MAANVDFDYKKYAEDPAYNPGAGRSNRTISSKNYIFRDEVKNRTELLWGNLDGQPVRFMLRGAPTDSGNDVVPALVAKPREPLTAPAEELYKLSTVMPVWVAGFIGPRYENSKEGLSFIDDYSPEEKKGRTRDEMPKTLFATLVERAPEVIGLNPQYAKFYTVQTGDKRVDNRKDWLSPAKQQYLVPVRVFETFQNIAVPVDGLLRLTETGYDSMLWAMTRTRPDWRGQHLDHGQLSTHQALIERFGFDACNPAGAPWLTLIGSRQRRAQPNSKARFQRYSGGGSDQAFGSSYTVTVDIPTYADRPYEYDLSRINEYIRCLDGDAARSIALVRDTYLSPTDLLRYMTPAEQVQVLMERSADPDWSEFILLCLQNTRIYEAIRDRAPMYFEAIKTMRNVAANRHPAEIYREQGAQAFPQPPMPAPAAPYPNPVVVRVLPPVPPPPPSVSGQFSPVNGQPAPQYASAPPSPQGPAPVYAAPPPPPPPVPRAPAPPPAPAYAAPIAPPPGPPVAGAPFDPAKPVPTGADNLEAAMELFRSYSNGGSSDYPPESDIPF
jgi:hypothetical protein